MFHPVRWVAVPVGRLATFVRDCHVAAPGVKSAICVNRLNNYLLFLLKEIILLKLSSLFL